MSEDALGKDDIDGITVLQEDAKEGGARAEEPSEEDLQAVKQRDVPEDFNRNSNSSSIYGTLR
jgi:hypothetical protein